ncbi:MAG: pyruvate kinase [Desulfurococcaceae archaeon]
MRTKIIATLGPSSEDEEIVEKMIIEGVSCLRVNCAHGDPDIWRNRVKIVNRASSSIGKVVSVMFDIPGPQVRTGSFEEKIVEAGEKIRFVLGESSDKGEIPLPNRFFFNSVSLGDIILYGDGEATLRVVSVEPGIVECIAVVDSVLRPGKKVVIQGKELDLPYLSERDRLALDSAIENNVCFIALSYVRSSVDISIVRNYLSRRGCESNLLVKIETKSSVEKLREIIAESDGVIIARGDLGLFLPLEEIPVIQKRIVEEALIMNKPSIVATEVLESMIRNPRPSRSDVVDLYNLIYSMVDAILLTNETAVGKYPVETVKWARKIIEAAERSIPKTIVSEARSRIIEKTLLEKYVKGLVLLAESLNGVIVDYSLTGKVPSYMFRYRPQIPVYIGSRSRRVLEKYTITYGVEPVLIEEVVGENEYEKGVELLYETLKIKGFLKPGDIVIKAYAKTREGIHEIKIEEVY